MAAPGKVSYLNVRYRSVARAPPRAPKMESFRTTVNGKNPLIVVENLSILDE